MKIFSNTIVRFRADYIDDDGEPAKERRYLVISVNKKRILLLKITSRFKSLFYQKCVGYDKCLDKKSYVNLNRKIIFDILSLEKNNYQKFYLCGHHSDGCVENKRFENIKNKLGKYWESEFNRDKEKILLDWSDLKDIEINSEGNYFY